MILPAALLAGSFGGEAVVWAGLLAGLLCLDDTALAQTWLGQPLPAALLAGLIFGDPLTGLALGLPLQLVLVGNLPVGQTFTAEATAGVVAAVAAAAEGGWRLVPALRGPGADPGPGPLGLLGWLLVAVGLVSLLGHVIVQTERRAHGVWMQVGRLSLRDGSLARMERLHLRCLLATFARGALLGALFLLGLRQWWIPAYPLLGERLHEALALLPLLLPAVGLGTMVDRYGPRRSWLWVAAGAVAAFAVAGLKGQGP